MPRYNVGVREVHVMTLTVEAENEAEAIRKAEQKIREGYDGSLETEYSHNLPTDDMVGGGSGSLR